MRVESIPIPFPPFAFPFCWLLGLAPKNFLVLLPIPISTFVPFPFIRYLFVVFVRAFSFCGRTDSEKPIPLHLWIKAAGKAEMGGGSGNGEQRNLGEHLPLHNVLLTDPKGG
jgi:hypothetical protein